MTPRLTFAILALLSQTGCVAAIPMAMQVASGANSTAQLCSMAKVPGQSASLCDSLPFGAVLQGQAASTEQPAQGTSHGKTVSAAR